MKAHLFHPIIALCPPACTAYLVPVRKIVRMAVWTSAVVEGNTIHDGWIISLNGSQAWATPASYWADPEDWTMVVPSSCCSKKHAVVPLLAGDVILKAAECKGYIERMAVRIALLAKIGSLIAVVEPGQEATSDDDGFRSSVCTNVRPAGGVI
jgi:hypothetical protein